MDRSCRTPAGLGSTHSSDIENLTGSNFNDALFLGHVFGTLNGGAGNDELGYGNGFGRLNGGSGNDHLTAHDAGVLNGGDGNDVLV